MTTKQARIILGESGKSYSDQEIENIISQLTELADILSYQLRGCGSNEPHRGIDETRQTHDNRDTEII